MRGCFHSLLTLNHGSLICAFALTLAEFSVKSDLEEVEYFGGDQPVLTPCVAVKLFKLSASLSRQN